MGEEGRKKPSNGYLEQILEVEQIGQGSGASGTSRERKDWDAMDPFPQPYLCVLRFPDFPLDGGLAPGHQLRLPSSAPHPAEGWASLNPASVNSPRERMYLGPSAVHTAEDRGLGL